MKRRGFTLMELLICMSIFSLVAAGAGQFMLQARRASTASEARVQLDRAARLTLERVGRDLRSATSVNELGSGVRLELLSQTVDYQVEAAGLVRVVDGKSDVVARRVVGLEVREEQDGIRSATVRLRRSMGRFPAIVVKRTAKSARRR